MGIETSKSNAQRSLFKATAKIGSWTMLSRILGFVRDIFIARLLGASPIADAFFVAFKLPNFFRRMFAEGTLTVALVPVLADERKKGEEDAHAYLNALAGLLLAALTVFTILGMVFMPWLLFAFAPGFHDEPDRWSQALSLARIMFPYLAMISLAAMSWAVLNAYRKFSVAAASPALLNIAILFAAIVIAPLYDNPAEALAIGVLLGGTLQLIIQFPALKRIGWVPKPTWKPKLPAIKQTMLLFGPAVLGIAAVQINILVGTILATLLPTGAVSYLYYADRVVQLPLALFGIAMGTALLPALSEHIANQRINEARHDLQQGLTWLTWIILPAVVGLMFLAEPIIRTLFEQGKFNGNDTINTAQALQAYTVGLLAFCWARVLSTACFAGKDAKAPMKFAMYTVIANIFLALILMQPMGYVGLALASALASFFNVGLLWFHLHHKQGSIFNMKSAWRMMAATLACLPMAALLYFLPQFWVFPETNKLMQFVWLGATIFLSMGLFFVSAWLLGEKKLLKKT